MRYERAIQTIIITSRIGPPTFVTWLKDNTTLVIDGTIYQQSQIITDTATATYESRLSFVEKMESLSGVYTCILRTDVGAATIRIPVTGETKVEATLLKSLL